MMIIIAVGKSTSEQQVDINNNAGDIRNGVNKMANWKVNGIKNCINHSNKPMRVPELSRPGSAEILEYKI